MISELPHAMLFCNSNSCSLSDKLIFTLSLVTLNLTAEFEKFCETPKDKDNSKSTKGVLVLYN